jgi:hypothetical protein
VEWRRRYVRSENIASYIIGASITGVPGNRLSPAVWVKESLDAVYERMELKDLGHQIVGFIHTL